MHNVSQLKLAAPDLVAMGLGFREFRGSLFCPAMLIHAVPSNHVSGVAKYTGGSAAENPSYRRVSVPQNPCTEPIDLHD